MSFLREKQSRHFFFSLIALSIFLLGFGGLFCMEQTQTVKEMLLSHDSAVVSSLLEHGVSPDVIASAVASSQDNGQGKSLITKLGYTERTAYKSKEFLKNTISDISHQLKTPLAALNMYNEIISEEPDNTKTIMEFSRKTTTALDRMEQLIQSLLKITRLDAGSVTFEKIPHRISEIIAKAIENLTTRALSEGKQIIVRGQQDEQITCDLQWTSEAVGNIVKNALDHTGIGGHICISWERSLAMIRISIADDGVGIAPEEIHHIFKRFYRSNNSKDTQGVGLGLSLAKSIIEGQGGVISVQSTLNSGTTFILYYLTEM
ncbi:HAMP domain-containing sensor histidine kinase [Clostridium sp. JN-9]|uniref:sensor histidine kinase n=1 Tax=Clostridium sp. JN-9 TaxID=2507159 RepID=UPI000FFE2587|nr:HAMP domain-containing sensor histidine kinase [Clostridium sp. JN-9]QAT39159.1 HAMP domain-containing histidine kinase [Clostridium sp. JN-9]